MQRFRSLFRDKRSIVIGMIHVGALPGTPRYSGSVEKLIESATREAEIYSNCSVDGVMVENMHDIPYVRSPDFGPEVVSTMTRLCSEIRNTLPSSMPCGVQVLAGGNKEAIAVAKSSGLQFIRAEGYVFGHVADEGIIEASAGPLLRYRRSILADDILIFTDVKKKHSSHAITSDINIEETSKAAQFFLSDGVIITGSETGSPADINQVMGVKQCVDIPVLIGSGVTRDNVEFYKEADGFIIGSHFKESGNWEGALSKDRILRFMDIISALKATNIC